MEKKIHDTLKDSSKDNESYQNLAHLVSDLEDEISMYKNYLDLLERVIRDDYDSIMITNLELKEPGPEIVYVNRGFTQMTGYSREEVIGNTPRILQGEKTDQHTLNRLKQKLENGESFFGHTVNYRKDGSSFVNQWDIHPLTDDEGEITHWVSYQHDITERKWSEKTWDDAQIEFDRIDEEVKSTKIDLDDEGTIINTNKLFRDLVKYGADELVGLKFWELLDKENSELFRSLFARHNREELSNREYDLFISTKQGEDIEVHAKTRSFQSHGQKIIRVHFSNRSLQKRIVEILQKRSKQNETATGKS